MYDMWNEKVLLQKPLAVPLRLPQLSDLDVSDIFANDGCSPFLAFVYKGQHMRFQTCTYIQTAGFAHVDPEIDTLSSS